jgi:F-type H+-transporting ATPase subunit epsilon
MAPTFFLEIVTPERTFFIGEIQEVIVKTLAGEIGVLKGHTPLVSAVEIGVARIKKSDGTWVEAVVSQGFMEVTNDYAILLTDSAEWPEEIDANRARRAKERAEERLTSHLSKLEYIRTQAALHRAIARLSVKRGMK